MLYFDKVISEHFRDVARVTGMTALMENGNPVTIDNHNGVAISLKKDHKPTNLKRVLFMLHYSANNGYKYLFSKSLCQYHPVQFMQAMNVEYVESTSTKRGKQESGCLERLAVRMFHQEKFLIIQKLKSVHVNNIRRKGERFVIRGVSTLVTIIQWVVDHSRYW